MKACLSVLKLIVPVYTNVKVTVWYNWLNWVRFTWGPKTYMHFVTNYGGTAGVIYIRSFSNFYRSSSSS